MDIEPQTAETYVIPKVALPEPMIEWKKKHKERNCYEGFGHACKNYKGHSFVVKEPVHRDFSKNERCAIEV